MKYLRTGPTKITKVSVTDEDGDVHTFDAPGTVRVTDDNAIGKPRHRTIAAHVRVGDR